MKYRDPSGLAPEKEKHKDEILTVLGPTYAQISFALWQECVENNSRNITMQRVLDDRLGVGAADWTYNDFTDAWGGWDYSGFGPGYGFSMKFSGSYSGLLAFSLPAGRRTYIDSQGNILRGDSWRVYTRTRLGIYADHDAHVSDDSKDKYGSEVIMNRYMDGVIRILMANPSFFDFTLRHPTSVVIQKHGTIQYKGTDVSGLHRSDVYGKYTLTIYLSAEAIMGDKIELYTDDPGRNPHIYYEFYEIIAHEFAHAMHYSLTGDEFKSYSYNLKEHFAINQENIIREHYERASYYNPRPSGWFFSYSWWKYTVRGY